MGDTRKKFYVLDEVNQKLSSWEDKQEKAAEVKAYIKDTIYKLTKFSSCPHHIKGEKIEINFDFENRDDNILKFISHGQPLKDYDYVIHFEAIVELLERVYEELEDAELSNLENKGYNFSELGSKIEKILQLL
ncbi:MAG: hypothetical protein ACQERJ_06290 [Bacillota bacterium]